MSNELIITPRTKVGELLTAYPDLEPALIDIAPAFKKLKNPVLRKTVGKVATLQQAAAIGNVPVDEIINKLRAIVGQDKFSGGEKKDYVLGMPSWFDAAKIGASLDAVPIINNGGHPLQDAIRMVNGLDKGQIFELITPFLPAPLIDTLEKMGCDTWTNQIDDSTFMNYFYKN